MFLVVKLTNSLSQTSSGVHNATSQLFGSNTHEVDGVNSFEVGA